MRLESALMWEHISSTVGRVDNGLQIVLLNSMLAEISICSVCECIV